MQSGKMDIRHVAEMKGGVITTMAKKSFKIPGVSFSWKRATGISKAKRKISKASGIPTTKSGRQKKIGKLLGFK